MADALVVEHRFNGPPASGQGGYVSGLLAKRLRGTVTVTLRKPTPLDEPLIVEPHPTRIDLLRGQTLIARAESGELILEPPGTVTLDEARAAQATHPAESEGLAPTCFGCGARRSPGDGLLNRVARLREGVAAGAVRLPSDLDDGQGRTPFEVLWAAMDCPGGWALGIFGLLPPDRFPALARMTAVLPGRAEPGQWLTAVGWPVPSPPERPEAGTALFDERGELVGLAHLVHVAMPMDWLPR